jgi:hypothetical protein
MMAVAIGQSASVSNDGLSLSDFHCFSGSDWVSILERCLFEGVSLFRDLRSPFRIPIDQYGIARLERE